MNYLDQLQTVPTIAALGVATLIFVFIKVWGSIRKQGIANFYRIYAAHIIELHERDIIDEETSLKYINNLIPMYELKFKFKYQIKDFFYDQELYTEATNKVRKEIYPE